MELKFVDPRALKPSPDKTRRSSSSVHSDAMLLASIKAVGICQPPTVLPDTDGGNGYVIRYGHRRTEQAIAAELDLIAVIVADPSDVDAIKPLIENVAHEPLNPVDLWRAVEGLTLQGWTDESIATALATTPRQVQKLRLLANITPAMLDQMAAGDMPSEQYLRTISAAPQEEQAEAWKSLKPKAGHHASWHQVATALSKQRMFARNASFDDELAAAYGIQWQDDLFAPADQDSRYTTDVEAFLGAQNEWMTTNLPKKGVVIEANQWGDPKLPAKAERNYGKHTKSHHTAMYLDREGAVKTISFSLPKDEKKTKGGKRAAAIEQPSIAAQPRPEITKAGHHMIGDLRTDALKEALARAPIEDDTLISLLVIALTGLNVAIRKPHSDYSGYRQFDRFVIQLLGEDGKLGVDAETIRIVARTILGQVLSCRRDATSTGPAALIAGVAIGADSFLANMGTEEFLSCLSRSALEATGKTINVLPRARVKDTRAAIVKHLADQTFVHPAARFDGDTADVEKWIASAPEGRDFDEEDEELVEDDLNETDHDRDVGADADPDGDETIDFDQPDGGPSEFEDPDSSSEEFLDAAE